MTPPLEGLHETAARLPPPPTPMGPNGAAAGPNGAAAAAPYPNGTERRGCRRPLPQWDGTARLP
ncbi:MAG: Ku protein, partial [Egibacteraceae bacterium]